MFWLRNLLKDDMLFAILIKNMKILIMLDIFMYCTPPKFFIHLRFQLHCTLEFIYRVENSIDPDQKPSVLKHDRGREARKSILGVSDQPAQLQRLARIVKFHLEQVLI